MQISEVIDACQNSQGFFFKFISANDTGTTGAHQAGFYMPNNIWPLFFDTPGDRGENKDLYINIRWNNDFDTLSRFIWYGRGTRSEYRLTRGLTFLEDDNVGDVLLLAKQDSENFVGFLLSTDEDLEAFFTAFNLSPENAYQLQFPQLLSTVNATLEDLFSSWLETINDEFPPGIIIGQKAREFWERVADREINEYDVLLLKWVETEYELFRFIENDRYLDYLQRPFGSVEELVEVANTILNRRKSRAGRSLENHLSFVFDEERIPYSSQPTTEGHKKPDFIFPGVEQYHDFGFPEEQLVFLAAKTTCKDRWRQILNEADRIPVKHLITLQPAISARQMQEMEESNVVLIVPRRYHRDYPPAYQSNLLTVHNFVLQLKERYLIE